MRGAGIGSLFWLALPGAATEPSVRQLDGRTDIVSVYFQGPYHLELAGGTGFKIRATAPIRSGSDPIAPNGPSRNTQNVAGRLIFFFNMVQ